jgi:Holliday junction resolvasome RuvABC endonuclease subunit
MDNKLPTIYLDVGFSRLGWAISKGSNLISYGTYTTSPKQDNGERLASIYQYLSSLILTYKIKDCLIELPVLAGVNGSNLSKVVGLVEMLCYLHSIKYRCISPKSMKLQLTGKGSASKDDVRFWVSKEIDVSKIPKKELDTIDAIGLFLVDRKNYELQR